MTRPFTHRDRVRPLEPQDLIHQTGRVDVTLSANREGKNCAINLIDPYTGTPRTVYLSDMKDGKYAPIESIRIHLTTTEDHAAAILEAKWIPAASIYDSHAWALEMTKNEKVIPMTNQFATNIPFGMCKIVSIDVVRGHEITKPPGKAEPGSWVDGLADIARAGGLPPF